MKIMRRIGSALLRVVGIEYTSEVVEDGVIYATGFYCEDGFQSVRSYRSESAAKAAIARSQKAWKQMQSLMNACGPEPQSFCLGRNDRYQFPSKDGYWYETVEAAQVADRRHSCCHTAAFQKAARLWTQEDEYIVI